MSSAEPAKASQLTPFFPSPKQIMKTLNILLADDHELILSGLKAILEGEPGWNVVGLARDGREAVKMAATLRPHVAVLDISMPELNGIEATRQIRRDSPETEVLILTMHNSEVVVREVIEAGAKGFILKTDTNRLLKTAIAPSHAVYTAIPMGNGVMAMTQHAI